MFDQKKNENELIRDTHGYIFQILEVRLILFRLRHNVRPERVERVRDGCVPFRTQSAAAAPAARRCAVGTADAAAAAARRLFRPQHAAHAEDV